MEYNFTCCFLQRVLLPLIIGICILARPVATSFVYLLMFFILPFIPIATSSKLKASLKAYFVILVMFTTAVVIVHCVLVICPLFSEENEIIKGCDNVELSIRHIGFILDQLNPADTLRWIWPDILLLSSSILVFIGLKTLSDGPKSSMEVVSIMSLEDEENNQLRILRKLGPILCLALLFLASAFRPSAPGGLYFVVFLFSATHWACYKPFSRGFAILLRFVMIVLVLHLIAILAYQTPWSQENIKSDTLPARLVALDPLILSVCDYSLDITRTSYYFNTSLHSDCFLAPAMILSCYFVLALTSNFLIDSKLYSRRSDTAMSETEDIELERFGQDRGEVTTTIFDHIWYGAISTGEFMYQNTYVFANILMMVWSIVYHSWLTFVLLIWANIIWLFPNQRKAMLRSSPFVVFYAEILLIAQYLYGMRLNDDELPTSVELKGINLQQIGLRKEVYVPCVPLFIKTAFTLMSWYTLRQRCKEKAEKKKISDIGTDTADLPSKPTTKKKSELIENVGSFIKRLLIKFWLWLLLGIVFMSASAGKFMTGFRICYMALFLFFMLSFQYSWKTWIKLMYGFWVVLIFYAMSTLILIYTYQFDRFDEYWKVYLDISVELQGDIGLDKYETRDLFLNLVTPTVIVIMTIIQINYFHKQFLEYFKMDVISLERTISPDVDVEALNAAGHSGVTQTAEMQQSSRNKNESQGRLKWAKVWPTKLKNFLKSVLDFLKKFQEFFWSFLEAHMIRIVIGTNIICSTFEVSFLHAILVVLSVIALMSRTWLQIYLSWVMSLFMSILIIANMMYQIEYIDHETFNVTCETHRLANSARWFGLYKNENLIFLLRGYLVYLVVATLHAIVIFRQEQKRASEGLPVDPPAVIFPKVTKVDANENLLGLVKYLFNYGFFRFGFELTMIALVSTIAYRRDLMAIFYAFWLCLLMSLEREKSGKIWMIFKWFLAIVIPLQFILYVGFPPALCVVYPWEGLMHSAKYYVLAMLPSPSSEYEAYKLIFDFVLFLFVCRQSRVYIVEKKFEKMKIEFPGGSNNTVITEIENLGMVSFENPIHDFKSYIRNWLDVLNIGIFMIFFWLTLAICFLAATNVLSIFSVGYLIGSFVFLWQGTDFYLRSIRQILLWWRLLLAYNIVVIAVRACLQIFLCLILDSFEKKHCWLVKLFGVACTENLKPNQNNDDESCSNQVDTDGLAWDATCFAFLIFQFRIFGSYYFCHVINDTKAVSLLAARGVVLIEDFRKKQIQHRTRYEKEMFRKIKEKLEKIKIATATEAEDDYMFDYLDEQIELNLLDAGGDLLEDEGNISAIEKKIFKRKGFVQAYQEAEKRKQEKKALGEDSSEKDKSKDEPGFIFVLLEGMMVSLAIRLHRLSRNFRYVMKLLSDEKKQLKEMMKKGKYAPFTKKNLEDRERNILGESEKLSSDGFDEDPFTTKEHPMLVEVIISIWFLMYSNTAVMCYLFVLIHQTVSASLLSLPLPIMVLLWGTLAIPRPSKSFWITLIAYLQAIVLIKYLFQFKSMWFETISLPDQPMTADKIIGIQTEQNYAVYDLMLLLVLFFHRFILKAQGLWDTIETEPIVQSGIYVLQDDLPDDDDTGTLDEIKKYAKETIKAVRARRFMERWKNLTSKLAEHKNRENQKLMKAKVFIVFRQGRQTAVVTKGPDTLVITKKKFGDNTQENEIDLHVSNSVEEPGNYVPEVIKISSDKYLSPITDFFRNTVHKVRLPVDVYALMFLCDFINFLVLLFGCTAFGPQSVRGDAVKELIYENKVPIPFLIMLLVQFFLIIIDRAIYLRKLLKIKILFHFVCVIGIHVWMFFILPAFTERSFNALAPPVIFYMFKFLYFLFSSYQIRCGYPKRVLGNFLARGYTYLNQLAYMGYKMVPFLYELRTLLDWVFVETTMTLWDWVRMEDIFSEIYNVKCTREFEKAFPYPRGEKKDLYIKLMYGIPFVSIIFLILWGPLLLFAIYNSVGKSNTPVKIDFTIKIDPYSPIYKISAMDVFQIFDESTVIGLESHYMKNKRALAFISAYEASDIAAISLPSHSPFVWGIPPPEKQSLLKDLLQNRDLIMRFTYTLTKSRSNQDTTEVVTLTTTFKLNEKFEGRKQMIAMLQGQSLDSVILVENVFPKFLEVKSSGKLIARGILSAEEKHLSLLLKLSTSGTGENSQLWWTVTENCNDSLHLELLSYLPSSNCESKIVIYTFNDKKFPTTLNWISAAGIIGMYTGIVLVCAACIRSWALNPARAIMFTDLPYVDRILQLCLDVYLVREAKEYALEGDLLGKLSYLYRSPETMIKWTRHPPDANEEEAGSAAV